MKTIKIYELTALTMILALIISCQPNSKLTTGEGFAEVTGGKVWYRIVGEGDKTPLLLLHGGPGVPSYYLNPLAALSKDRPVIFIDQLGCGRSDRNIDTTLMTIENYVEQLEQLKIVLGLKEFYLYGHSWGTMLGTEYYYAYPDGVKALILSSSSISIPMWLRDADTLISTLPDSIQTAINTNERNGTYDSPEYQQAVLTYNQNFLARKLPWTADLDSAFAQINEEIYQFMWGPSEFTATGNLKDYDRTNKLSDIKIPTLFITGEFDEARPSTVQYYQSLVPNSRFVMIEDAAHLTMHDNPEKDIQTISSFLHDIERN